LRLQNSKICKRFAEVSHKSPSLEIIKDMRPGDKIRRKKMSEGLCVDLVGIDLRLQRERIVVIWLEKSKQMNSNISQAVRENESNRSD